MSDPHKKMPFDKTPQGSIVNLEESMSVPPKSHTIGFKVFLVIFNLVSMIIVMLLLMNFINTKLSDFNAETASNKNNAAENQSSYNDIFTAISELEEKEDARLKKLKEFVESYKDLESKIKTQENKISEIEKDLAEKNAIVDQAAALKSLYELLFAVVDLKHAKSKEKVDKIKKISEFLTKLDENTLKETKLSVDIVNLTDMLAKKKKTEKLFSAIEMNIRSLIEKIKLSK
jgi:hypothetical protein